MRPTKRLFLFALTIFLLFGTALAVNAQPDCIPVTAGTSIDDVNTPVISCDDPPICYSDSILEAKVPYQINYYKFTLGAGQKLIIDVDTQTNDSRLDALLEVFETEGPPFLSNNDQTDNHGDIISLDPYLEFVAPPDGDVTYFMAISAGSDEPTDPDDNKNTGTYTFSLQCSDQPTASEFKWPVVVGDLLGATGSDTGSLINITPENAESSLPFPLGIGPIADIEFDPSSDLVFVAVDAVDAVDYIPGRIVAIDPNSGNEVESYSLETESVIALEAAENKLYGIRVDSFGENFTLALVTFNIDSKTATLTDVVSLGRGVVRALAYDQSEKVMYGASGVDLVKIDLAPSSPIEIQKVTLTTGLLSDIVALDFSHEDVLYGVDRSGNLFNVPNLTTGQAVHIGDPITGVTGLTFVVEKASQDVEPIKTICSSTLTSPMTASTEAANRKLSRFKLKNRMRRAIGLFKFEATAGENITIHLAPEEEESAEAVVEESAVSTMEQLWPRWRGKGRVFLGVRDSIPDVDLRVRKKGTLPLELSVEDLPADGSYYIMVIRPLFRLHKADYCLTLESDDLESQAWQTLQVAWPSDDSDVDEDDGSEDTQSDGGDTNEVD